MEKFFEKLFDIKKIPTKLIFVIWLSSVLLLFVPQRFLTELNITDFLKDYGKYIGITFIISSAFLLVTLISFVSQHFSRNNYRNKIKKSILRDIMYLDNHEKALLREFYINGKHTLQLPLDNETVVGLVNKHIIYQASGTGFTFLHGIYFPYSMTEVAVENLKFEMIDFPTEPTEDEKRRILNERPTWAKEKSLREDRINSRW
ncbi:superinfection exclusion B family protein [Limnovirga soli]|uniref:Superinfection exclusion protein B n=1 Tax=Limnovirga soli TaxID=2656915 RepID=A0A8J8FC58_9BACT|nr:superinfection exclusion B family protein [Limnovirga soli]NNV55030.1 hypothetical protein [Limnovirga soli]